jgi:hypothetical protein
MKTIDLKISTKTSPLLLSSLNIPTKKYLLDLLRSFLSRMEDLILLILLLIPPPMTSLLAMMTRTKPQSLL